MNNVSIYQTSDNHAEVELERKPTVAKIATTAACGKTYLIQYFQPGCNYFSKLLHKL